ncbi:MAG: hypothetical protein ACFUZC_11060 [Chthoniobacteraceae bacterium]
MTPKAHFDFLDSDSMEFLAGFTAAAIEASRVYPGQRPQKKNPVGKEPGSQQPSIPGNCMDYTLIRPGGRKCYPAVWTQDFSMTLGTGFVTPEEAHHHLRLIAKAQNGPEERRLASSAVVPPFAIPDHVLFNGEAIFFPGTYSSGEDQGGERWGLRPPVNNHYDFILIARHILHETQDGAFLLEVVNGIPLIERLRRAFEVPAIDRAMGLVSTEAAARAVGFIFCDSIYMTGHLLFASLLRWRAARQMAELERFLGEENRVAALESDADRIPPRLPSTFGDSDRIGGWLMAATEVGRQPDVWGTIYALYLGVLRGGAAQAARKSIVQALEEGTICYEGALRHVPTNYDASPTSAWERTHTPLNRYQNGAFWHTPTGWLIAILAETHPDLAAKVFNDMIAHFRREDFRQGPQFNAPWECIGPEVEAYSNPVFLASATLPYEVLRKLNNE